MSAGAQLPLCSVCGVALACYARDRKGRMVAPGRPPPSPAAPRQPPPSPSNAVARRKAAAYTRGGGTLGGLSWVSLLPSCSAALPARCACGAAWQRVPACAASLAHPPRHPRRPLPCGRSSGQEVERRWSRRMLRGFAPYRCASVAFLPLRALQSARRLRSIAGARSYRLPGVSPRTPRRAQFGVLLRPCSGFAPATTSCPL